MHPATDKLLSIASDPLGKRIDGAETLSAWGTPGIELAEMLARKNGFYAYESALLVRPLRRDQAPLGVLEWNEPRRWKSAYAAPIDAALCFAEDVFGGQYGIKDGAIFMFDPETGLFEQVAASLHAWADAVTADYALRTGYPLAHAWQMLHGPLTAGSRLVPKLPFVLGGQYEVENLYSLADEQGMLVRAEIANQIRDLPDGATITIGKRKSPD